MSHFFKFYFSAALLAGGMACPAAAQDQPIDPAFAGVRVEALAGYDEGLLYGVGAGYDFAAGQFVLGIEGEVSDSTASDCVNDIAGKFCAKIGRDLYAGGRLGAIIGTSTLLYVKAGYTNVRVKYGFDGGANMNDFTDELDGIRIGAGVEMALGGNAFVKGEYRYSNYEDGAEGHNGLVGLGIRF